LVRFVVFCPTRVTQCTNQGQIWLGRPKFHSSSSSVQGYKYRASIIIFGFSWNIIADYRHILHALTLLVRRQEEEHPACKNGGMVEVGTG